MKKNRELTKKQQKIIAVTAMIVVVLLVGILMWVVGRPLLQFVTEPEKFRAWVDENGIKGQLLYVGCVILQVLIAFVPGEPLELAGGYAFGTVEGSLLCLGASVAGSILVFGLVRRYGIRLVEVFYPTEKLRNLRFLRKSPKRDILYAIIFTIPGTPKDLLCYFAGLTDMKFSTFLLIASLGRIPSLITSTLSGGALGAESYVPAVIVLVVTLVISGVGLLIYRHICKKQNREPMEYLKEKVGAKMNALHENEKNN